MALDINEKKEIQQMIKEALTKAFNFSARKLGDTPTDDLQLTPRKFVTGNGVIASRPASSEAIVGQFYLATDIPTPMWRVSNGWVNGVGSVVAGN